MTSSGSPFRFTFDDVVRVIGEDPELAPIRGELGVIVGRGEDAKRPGYGVWIYSVQRVWSVEEDEIEATGHVDPAQPSPVVARVAVDEHGAGHLIGVHDRDPAASRDGAPSTWLRSPIVWVVVAILLGAAIFGPGR